MSKIPVPTHRYLKGYVFDPSFSSTLKYRLTNEVVYRIRWEHLEPGPIGEYIEVIDYDPIKQSYCEPVDLNDKYILARQGLDISDDNPQYHQQLVYAVVMSVIGKFEKALGRKLIFSRYAEITENGKTKYQYEFVRRLRIYPHAMYEQNAYYSPEKKALLFGYFRSEGKWTANNIPGIAIFNCLSPDIVSHECTHAILDSIHPYLNKNTNPDMLAFHEGFADLIALLSRFDFRNLIQEQIRNSKGDLQSQENMLGNLAYQFGQAMPTSRKSLRSYLFNSETGKPVEADPAIYHSSTEPHERGAVLVATIFDAFSSLYNYRVADLLRIATQGTGIMTGGAISPDLVNRLSEEACKIAEKLLLICIRALDYCPPADLTFSDYLRGLITADVEHNPDDEDGLRFALMEAFRSWGIVPADLNSYSLQSLLWQSPEDYYGESQLMNCLKAAFKRIFSKDNPEYSEISASMDKILRENVADGGDNTFNTRENIFIESNKLAAKVHKIFNDKSDTNSKGMERLVGLCFDPIVYEMKHPITKEPYKLNAEKRDVYQIQKCRPIIRNKANNGETSRQMIVTIIQKVFVDLKGSPYMGYFDGDQYIFRGGATIIIDLSTLDIKFSIVKSISSADRLQQQLSYASTNMGANANSALLMQSMEPFKMVHSH